MRRLKIIRAAGVYDAVLRRDVLSRVMQKYPSTVWRDAGQQVDCSISHGPCRNSKAPATNNCSCPLHIQFADIRRRRQRDERPAGRAQRDTRVLGPANIFMWPTMCGHIMKRCGCLFVCLSVCHVSYLENGAR